MPKLTVSVPKYARHKAKGLAFVRLSGRVYYLGAWQSPASKAEYTRLLALYHANGCRMPADDGVTVSEMLERYRLHCESFYRHPNGEPTGEAGTIGLCCRPLRELYSDRPANEFGPLDLQAVRRDMIANRKWSRSFINAAVRKIVRAFRWAASQQLIPVSVVDALRTVDGLKAGRTEARESRPVVAVSDDAFSATLPHLPPIIRDMALIGRLTGWRPGEICAMRPADIDRSRPVWVYSPRLHKNSWRGKDRRVFIAADAQAILETYLNRAPEAHCFSPGESIGRMRRPASQPKDPRVVRQQTRQQQESAAEPQAGRTVHDPCLLAGDSSGCR